MRVFVLLFLTGLIAGCAPQPAPDGSVADGTPAAQSDKPSDSKGAADNLGEAEKPAAPAETARIIRFDPDEFVGYSPERVLPILGAPDFVRRDGTAQVWQYRAENCVLDLFLYGAAGESRVKHVELRERVPGAEPVEECFSRMRTTRQPKPSG